MTLRQSRQLSGWHPEEIKAAIRMRGQTVAGLALQNGFSESYLRIALHRPLYRGEQIIAAFLRTPPNLIWPDRYDARGNPTYRAWASSRHRRRFA